MAEMLKYFQARAVDRACYLKRSLGVGAFAYSVPLILLLKPHIENDCIDWPCILCRLLVFPPFGIAFFVNNLVFNEVLFTLLVHSTDLLTLRNLALEY